jgi:hypothetical protein
MGFEPDRSRDTNQREPGYVPMTGRAILELIPMTSICVTKPADETFAPALRLVHLEAAPRLELRSRRSRNTELLTPRPTSPGVALGFFEPPLR